jgi:subtilisin family serine protease
VAPGVNIPTTTINNGYTNKTGTSFAVAFADATAALIWSSKVDPYFDFHGGGADGFWENDEVWAKMVLNGKLDLGPLGKDNDTGWGLVNAWMANQRPLGDVNNDHKTDIKDVLTVAKAYGSIPGDWNWDPRADIDINKKVDIKDMLLVQKHYGEVDP